jgi:hypothetical protein
VYPQSHVTVTTSIIETSVRVAPQGSLEFSESHTYLAQGPGSHSQLHTHTHTHKKTLHPSVFAPQHGPSLWHQLLFLFSKQYWALNSGPHTCQAVTLPLDPLLQPFLL